MPRLKHWPILRYNLRFPTLCFRSFRARDNPEGVRALQKAYIERWWRIIKELGIKPE
jgi:hypothetical protein